MNTFLKYVWHLMCMDNWTCSRKLSEDTKIWLKLHTGVVVLFKEAVNELTIWCVVHNEICSKAPKTEMKYSKSSWCNKVCSRSICEQKKQIILVSPLYYSRLGSRQGNQESVECGWIEWKAENKLSYSQVTDNQFHIFKRVMNTVWKFLVEL